MNDRIARIVPCPTCRKPVHFSPEVPTRPFCSERCRMIDLGAWASEELRIPGDRTFDDLLSGELDKDDPER